MTRPPWPPALLAAVAAAGLLSSGCGSGGSSGAGSTTTTTTTSATTTATATGTSGTGRGTKAAAQDQGVKFAACIRSHGVADFPDPDAKGEFQYGVSVTPAVWQKATSACKDLQPPGSLSSERTPKEQAASLKFAACIRDNGVKDFPDPVDGEPLVNTYKIPSSGTPGGMTILNAAMAKCGKVVGVDTAGQG